MTKQNIHVVVALSRPLLGLPTIKALKLKKRVHEIKAQKEDFKAQNPTVFSGLGKLKEPYSIELEPGAVPYGHSTPR